VSRRTPVLKGKTILAVDDEPDILETIEEVLEVCEVETAGTFHKAQELLKTRSYDLVILDIMGVKGLDLLDTACEKGFPSVMLTAPAINPEYILQAVQRGAVSYLPKGDLIHLEALLTELLELIEKGNSPWPHIIDRLGPLLDERFGLAWREEFSKVTDTINRNQKRRKLSDR
jgi:CheY-like chemotaxis protein